MINAKLGVNYFLVIGILLAASIATPAQINTDQIPDLLPPKEEKFIDAGDYLIIPWVRIPATCLSSTGARLRDCPIIPESITRAHHYHKIYDQDGDVWYEFSDHHIDADHYSRRPKAGFQPLGPNPIYPETGPPLYPLTMRLVRESPNWYEVEVNEQTRDTKFLLRSEERSWARVTWTDIFNINYGRVAVDITRTRVLDKPNGQPVECSHNPGKYHFGLLEGDWMRVNDRLGSGTTACKGWIRWRDGRDILVGSYLNGMKVPEPKVGAPQ